jgi:hypothetical protein
MKRLNCDQILKTSGTGKARPDVCIADELNMAVKLFEKLMLSAISPLCAQQFFQRKEPVLNYCH